MRHIHVRPGSNILSALLLCIVVSGCGNFSPTAQKPAPIPDAPTAFLTLSPTTIGQGSSATITWHTTGATSASITGIGAVALDGSMSVSPIHTTTYTLTAIATAGVSVETASTENVTVTPIDPEQRIEFQISGHYGFLVKPVRPTSCWVWFAPTFIGSLPGPETQWLFDNLASYGVWIGGVDVGESYGNQEGRDIFSDYDAFVTQTYNVQNPILLAQSRGGLMHLNWAEDHPDKIQAIAGIYPVVDMESYPGLSSPTLQAAYGYDESELLSNLSLIDPIDRVPPLVQANIPLFLIAGDADTAVPPVDNSIRLDAIYKANGGNSTLVIVPGLGHETAPEFFQSPELLNFILASCGK